MKAVVFVAVVVHLKTALLYAGMPVGLPATTGPVSWFGGPGDVREWGPPSRDKGIGASEKDWRGQYLLRELGSKNVQNGDPYYIAMRWFDPNDPPSAFQGMEVWRIKDWYAEQRVAAVREDIERMVVCWIADWGPKPGREYVADMGPEVLKGLCAASGARLRFGWATKSAPTGIYILHHGVWILECERKELNDE